MTKQKIASIIVIVLVGLLAGAYYYKPIYDLKEAVKNELIDPDSAKFKDIYINRKAQVGCGRVNSKNKMGGYAGDRFFVVFTGGTGRVVFDETSLEDRMARLDRNEKFTNPLAEICYKE